MLSAGLKSGSALVVDALVKAESGVSLPVGKWGDGAPSETGLEALKTLLDGFGRGRYRNVDVDLDVIERVEGGVSSDETHEALRNALTVTARRPPPGRSGTRTRMLQAKTNATGIAD